MSENLKASALIVAIDNGADLTRVGLYKGDEYLRGVSYDTPATPYKAIDMLDNWTNLLADGHKVDFVGWAIAGQVEDDKLVGGGQLKHNGWCTKPPKLLTARQLRSDGRYDENLSLPTSLAERIGIEAARVVMLNDCEAAAKSQSAENRLTDHIGPSYMMLLNRGLGGARITPSEEADTDIVVDDELGHKPMRDGSKCPCGEEGHIEAYVSGSGIETNFGISSEYLKEPQRRIVVADAVEAQIQTIKRFNAEGFKPNTLYYCGDVVAKLPWLIKGMRAGLNRAADRKALPFLPEIRRARKRELSSLSGALLAATELALAA